MMTLAAITFTASFQRGSKPMRTLFTDRLRSTVPGIFTPHAYDDVSNRCAFIPTSEVIGVMRDQGFQPVKATQSNP
jgi:hypothetical protein